MKLQIRQYPADLEHDDHHHHDLSGRQRRRDQGLHHHADRAGGGERRGRRHAGLEFAAERLDHHAEPAAQRQRRPGDGRRARQGQPGRGDAAARRQRSGRRQADRAGHRAALHVVQFDGDDARRRSPTISSASSSRACRPSTASPTRRSSAARISPCASGSIPTRWRRAASRANDIRNALAANNFTSAAGQIKSDFTQTSINALTSLDNAQAFGQLVISNHGDALVRLGDVARIELGPESVDSSVDVRRAQGGVHRRLRARPNANPLTVIDGRAQGLPRRSRRGCRPASRARSPMTRPNSSAPRSTKSPRPCSKRRSSSSS